MTAATTNVAILGAGYISDYHLTALRRLPNVQVRAICDVNRALAQQFADAKGIPLVYDNLDTMLATEQLDAVHVLTPPHIHFPTASKILAAGVDAFIEKPLCHTVDLCQQLQQIAKTHGRTIGVSHNFLYFPAYERLLADVRSGRLGQIDQIDIVWNKELGQLRGGPFGAWMLQSPTNILFEVAPHSLAHVIHLAGMPDRLSVDVHDKIELPRGLPFYRRWEVRGWKGNTSIRMRFSFVEGYPEHYIHVRGSNGVGRVDFERNTYVCQEHTPYLLDIDRFVNVVEPARDSAVQAAQTLGHFFLSKMKLSKVTAPFPYSIARTVESFYETRTGELDERIGAPIGEAAIALGEWIAREANLPVIQPQNVSVSETPLPKSTVLVIGGTGFIGQALVRRLREAGHGVRLLTRNPNGCPAALKALQVELVRGDFTDAAAVDQALEGIEYVYHLARGTGKTWAEFLKTDVDPTTKVGELCVKHGVKRLFYTSSIAIYYAGKKAGVITEATPASRSMARVAPYTRSKVENEARLLHLHKTQGLPVVIFRPGVVLGSGGNPYHWGIAAWPYHSVCNLWGNGHNPLPIVLVEDVADALVRALPQPGLEGESFNLASRPYLSSHDYLDAFERQAGVQIKRVPVSPRRFYVTSLGKWAIKKVGRDPEAAFPSYEDCDGRSLAAVFDCTKAEQTLGWTPSRDRDLIISEGIHIPVKEYFQ
jgi:nucleoside-diphosphate-sugar epimerase